MTIEKNQRKRRRSSHTLEIESSNGANSETSSGMPDEVRRRYPIWSIMIVALAALAAASGLIFVSAARVTTAKSPVMSQVYLDGMAKGPKNAKVQIVVYSDFQCPSCARFALTTSKQIEELYVKRGLVRLEYRNYAFLGQESHWAAQAAEAANEQGMFWPYHDKLMASQRGENKGSFNRQNLKRFAAEMGLKQSAFDQALDTGRYADKVTSATFEAEEAGINRTPTFVINGRKLVGNQPFEAFQKMIEEEFQK